MDNPLSSLLIGLPERSPKPRKFGLNIIYDNGTPLPWFDSFLSSYGDHVDAVEIGYGPAFLINDLKERVALCKKYNTIPFLTGFVFEVFLSRGKVDEYISICKELGFETFQTSDHCLNIPHSEKCSYIEKLSKHGTVFTRVGSKDAAHIIPPYKWVELMKQEIVSGASLVFAESRETGNVGIYRGSGEVREGLVHELLVEISPEKIVWDAPLKSQQVYFIEILREKCNLSRIKPENLLALETIRLGLAPETFNLFLPKES